MCCFTAVKPSPTLVNHTLIQQSTVKFSFALFDTNNNISESCYSSIPSTAFHLFHIKAGISGLW